MKRGLNVAFCGARSPAPTCVARCPETRHPKAKPMRLTPSPQVLCQEHTPMGMHLYPWHRPKHFLMYLLFAPPPTPLWTCQATSSLGVLRCYKVLPGGTMLPPCRSKGPASAQGKHRTLLPPEVWLYQNLHFARPEWDHLSAQGS